MLGALTSLTGGGGLTGGAAEGFARGESGDALGTSGTGDKIFNIGGNPNVKTANNAMMLAAAVAVVWFLTRNTSSKK